MELLTVLLIIIVFGLITYITRKEDLSEVKENVAEKIEEKRNWSHRKFMSQKEVQQAKEELQTAIDENFVGEERKGNLLKDIVQEWADLKLLSFQERRSWVRTPEKNK